MNLTQRTTYYAVFAIDTIIPIDSVEEKNDAVH